MMSVAGILALIGGVLAGIALAWTILVWWLDAPKTPVDTRHLRVRRGLDDNRHLVDRWRRH